MDKIVHLFQPGRQGVASAPEFTPMGTITATLTIASAVSIGSNMVDVRNGTMNVSQAIFNGLAKGAAASLVLNATARSTTAQVVMVAGVLVGAGYLIDTAMKKGREVHCCHPEKSA